MNDTFKFIVPASLEKSNDGKWIIKGLASEEVMDQQGEIVIQKGINLTHIDEKKGMINWNHDNSPEATIGLLTGYNRQGSKTYIQGELFKGHEKAKAVYGIMEGLAAHGSRAMGLSIEGKILTRNPNNPRIIEKCVVKNVALTLSPVFKDSYAELVKSFNAAENIEFDTEANKYDGNTNDQTTFTTAQVLQLIQKALGVGDGAATQPPGERSGGDALAQESMDRKAPNIAMTTAHCPPKKKKKLKKNCSDMYKSYMGEILDKIQVLYPNNSREEIWGAIKDRIYKKFPDLDQND